MNRKPHILESKKITETCNPKRSSKFMRGHGVLHSILRNLMSMFIKIISLYKPINIFAILHPTSLANLVVVEVGTRHSHQILLVLIACHPRPPRAVGEFAPICRNPLLTGVCSMPERTHFFICFLQYIFIWFPCYCHVFQSWTVSLGSLTGSGDYTDPLWGSNINN